MHIQISAALAAATVLLCSSVLAAPVLTTNPVPRRMFVFGSSQVQGPQPAPKRTYPCPHPKCDYSATGKKFENKPITRKGNLNRHVNEKHNGIKRQKTSADSSTRQRADGSSSEDQALPNWGETQAYSHTSYPSNLWQYPYMNNQATEALLKESQRKEAEAKSMQRDHNLPAPAPRRPLPKWVGDVESQGDAEGARKEAEAKSMQRDHNLPAPAPRRPLPKWVGDVESQDDAEGARKDKRTAK